MLKAVASPRRPPRGLSDEFSPTLPQKAQNLSGLGSGGGGTTTLRTPLTSDRDPSPSGFARVIPKLLPAGFRYSGPLQVLMSAAKPSRCAGVALGGAGRGHGGGARANDDLGQNCSVFDHARGVPAWSPPVWDELEPLRD